MKNVLVFCGSSTGVSSVYMESAEIMGDLLGQASFDVVYGGGLSGMMGAVARAALKAGSRVFGIMPEAFRHSATNEVPEGLQEKVVETLMHRKSDMLFMADAAIVLPGGIGTLDELWEIAAAQDLRFYDAPDELVQPLIVVNIDGFYDATIEQLCKSEAEGFIKPGRMRVFHFAKDPAEAMQILEEYRSSGRHLARDLYDEKALQDNQKIVSESA